MTTLALALQMLVALGSAAPPDAQWQHYEPPDRSFKVRLPAVPHEVHGQWAVYIALSGPTGFGIRVSPVHSDKVNWSDVQLYDWFQRVESHNSTVTRSRAVTSGERIGREFIVSRLCTRGPCLLTFRVFRESDRLFILTVWATPDNPATTDTATFLDSFRITGP